MGLESSVRTRRWLCASTPGQSWWAPASQHSCTQRVRSARVDTEEV